MYQTDGSAIWTKSPWYVPRFWYPLGNFCHSEDIACYFNVCPIPSQIQDWRTKTYVIFLNRGLWLILVCRNKPHGNHQKTIFRICCLEVSWSKQRDQRISENGPKSAFSLLKTRQKSTIRPKLRIFDGFSKLTELLGTSPKIGFSLFVRPGHFQATNQQFGSMFRISPLYW